MQTLKSNLARVGNFTSSEIAALMTNGRVKDSIGKPALTYIEECNMERGLGKPLDNETNSRPTTWGQLVENRVFELLTIDYKLVSQETIVHPVYNFWAGSPDANKFDEGRTVVDIKSPFTLKSFCQLVAPLYRPEPLKGLDAIEYIRFNHKEGDKYYWQLVSNAILTDSRFAELIVYCPYKNELEEIRDIARIIDSDKQYRYRWIDMATDDELPWLLESGKYKNLNKIRFEVPISDKQELVDRVRLCGKMLDTEF